MTTKPVGGKLTIDELEKLLNKSEDSEIEIRPNGEIVQLAPEALAKKELRLIKEEIEVLRNHKQRLRDGLKRILAELEEL